MRAFSCYQKSNKWDLDFFQHLILYATSKYILAGFLYGTFTVKFLLRKYNKQFLTDLGNSRFFRFLEIYTNPEFGLIGYDRYFRCDKCKRGCKLKNKNRATKRDHDNCNIDGCTLKIKNRVVK